VVVFGRNFRQPLILFHLPIHRSTFNEGNICTDGWFGEKTSVRDNEHSFRLRFECLVRLHEWFRGYTSFKESKSSLTTPDLRGQKYMP